MAVNLTLMGIGVASQLIQSFTFIDIGGNRADYAVSDEDFHWSTDYGDRGVGTTFEQAQNQARNMLKNSMAADRRSKEKTTAAGHSLTHNIRW